MGRGVKGQESVCPEPTYWRVKGTAVEGNRLVLHLVPVRTPVFPALYAGFKASESTAVTGGRLWTRRGSIGRCG